MIKELKEEKRSKAGYIRRLQKRGVLATYKSDSGFIAYDVEEYTKHKENAVYGRPTKNRCILEYKLKDILAIDRCDACPLRNECIYDLRDKQCDIVILQQEINNLL